MKGRILLLAAILFIPSNLAFATLGPVHVELMLRPWGKYFSARANAYNNIEISFRINKDIKYNDNISVWLPLKEAGNKIDITTDICDGLPEIYGKNENVRFLPNSSYFKKFPDSNEKEVCKIYNIIDYKGTIEIIVNPGNDAELERFVANSIELEPNSIIKDKSGLGYWLMGTILPPMPIDDKKRFERLVLLSRSQGTGYHWCYESGFPKINNTANLRKLVSVPTLEVEANRKGYQPVVLTITKNTGILAPATPGRYTLAIATTPEPEPVESEAFVLPCSDISDVKCKVVNDLLSVDFKTGEGGALDGGASMVILKFPQEITLPKTFQAKSIRINGAFVTGKPVIDIFPDHNELKLVLPSDIPNLGAGKIEFLENSGITFKKLRGKIKVSLSSSSEPNFIESDEFSAFQPYTLINPSMELAPSAIRIRTLVPESKPYPKDAAIVLTFPAGFRLPAQPNTLKVLVNNKPLEKPCKVEGQTLTINSPVPIDFNLDIEIQNGSGLTNPGSGTYKIAITTDGTSLDAGEFEITESKALVSNLMLSSEQAALACTYEFDYQPSIKNLPEVGDVFSVIFPEGTKLPTDPDPSNVTIDGKPVISIGVKGQTLKIGSPIKFVFGKWVHFAIGCGINNPRKHGPYTLSVGVGEAEPAISEEYLIEPSPLKSWIYFKDPDKPNCGEWFNKPPILGFDCLNPDAKISFWFNNQPERDIIYGGEARMMPGTFQTTISWQAEFNGVKEDQQTIEYRLDTQAPEIIVQEPKAETTRVNKNKYTLEIERGFSEILTYGDKSKYQAVDSVILKTDDNETLLMEGEIYETTGSGIIQYKTSYDLKLKEGINYIQIIGRDQACNETIIRRAFIFDSIPPKINLVSPKSLANIVEGTTVELIFTTESDANVYVNGAFLAPISFKGDTATFIYKYKAIKGINKVEIQASDASNNKSTKTITFTVMPKQTVIVLTMDKTKWMVNGIEQTPLKVAPTNKFTDPKLKTLTGTTFMPISQIAPYFDCQLVWNPKEKKTTINQLESGKVIELWIGKDTAKIDGKEVRFDSKGIIFPFTMNGSTMLPFRWFAENLGASVSYDAKTKTITLRYPK